MIIHKYMLPRRQGQYTIPVPSGSRFIAAREQHEHVALWYEWSGEALVTSQNANILLVMTGQDVNMVTQYKYLGTCMFDNGAFVLHAYHFGE